MWRTAWRGMLSRKLRLALSALAVVLGVAFVTGSQIFAQTLTQHLTATAAGSVPDVVVQPADAAATDARLVGGSIDDRVVTQVAALPEVAQAEGEVLAEGVLVLDANHESLSPIGASALGANYHDLPGAGGADGMFVHQGTAPQGSHEVALDPATVERGGFALGQEVTVVTPAEGPRAFTLSGTIEPGMPLTAGSTLTVFDTATAQETLAAGADQFHRVAVSPTAATSPQDAAGAIAAVLPSELEAVTGEVIADRTAQEMGGSLATITMVLYGFAGVSVLVGGFLIVNTFSMLVQQRRQEIALLRSIGARSRQVRQLVLGEAALLGAIASAVGVVLGIGLAAALTSLFSMIGADVSGMGLVIGAVPLVVGFLVGLVATVLAAWIPVRGVADIAPVEALRTASAQTRTGRARAIVGALSLGLGLAALAAVVTRAGQGPALVALGTALALLGLVLLTPVLVRPVIAGLGSVLSRTHGSLGVLAQRNAERNPRRTGATAAALVVGLAMVSALSVVAGSVRSSVAHHLEDTFAADLVVATPNNAVLPEPLAGQIEAVPGVDQVSGAATVPVEVDGASMSMAVEDVPATITSVSLVEGDLADVGGTHVAVDDTRAAEFGLGVGDAVVVASNGVDQEVTVAAIYREMSAVVAPWLAQADLAASFGWPAQDVLVGVTLEADADQESVRTLLNAELDAHPLVAAYDAQEFTQLRIVEVDQLAGLVYLLLALAVLIAILGVVNTLALSVVERQREIGLLRAVGLRRKGTRQVVRLEAVLICVAGAVLGLAAGPVFGAAVQRLMEDSGIVVLDVPWVLLASCLVVAGLVALVAAALPARSASHTDVLRAIAAP